ncbi:MAG: radical SAM protein, partial [Muribaculaceae bacterium]|nr:radical SAM protein [Muribaculaceae bacterium]
MAGIYVHIPFCHSKCIYCDFFSTPNLKTSDNLIDALIKEYHHRSSEINESVKTLYFGGGTPSIIAADQLARVCEALPLSDVVEFTIEANPEDVSQTAVKAWRELGVNRVSMGIQSFCDEELRAIGRRHSADDARRAIKCLLDGGITNLSCA